MIKVEENYGIEFLCLFCCGDIDHTRKHSKVEPSDGHISTIGLPTFLLLFLLCVQSSKSCCEGSILTEPSLNIELSSKAYPNRMLVSNIGRVIVKKLEVKFKGKELLSVDDSDVPTCY